MTSSRRFVSPPGGAQKSESEVLYSTKASVPACWSNPTTNMDDGDPFLALHSGAAPAYPEESYWWLPSPPVGPVAGPSTLPILEALAKSTDSGGEPSPEEDEGATAARSASPATASSTSKSPDGPRPRVPKRRTRTGCKACRERRVKCDEGRIDELGQKWACRSCIVRRVPCLYPAPSDDGSGHTRQWASPAMCSQTSDTPTSSGASTSREVAPTLARIAREAAQKLALGTSVGAPEYTVLETLAAGGDPVRFIGTAAVTDPEHDHFQAEMLPFLRRQFSRSSKPPEDDRAVLYHAAIRLGFIARPETVSKAEEHRMLANEAANRAVLQRCESETLMSVSNVSPNARHKSSVRSLTSYFCRIARALLLLGNIIISQPIAVPAEHLVADVTTPLGYQIYDILCAYRTWIALVDGTQRISTPVPLAGDRYLESTFGVARSMWDLLGRTIDLLVQRRTLDALPVEMTRPLLEPDVNAIFEKGRTILENVSHSRSKRIHQGTEVRCPLTRRRALDRD